jgi:MSHA pilin protein MshD
MNLSNRQQGVTLVELVVSIVILSVAATGILMVITQAALTSADPMLREQGTAIAQSYMEEVISQPLTDPDGATGETDRAVFDDVWDYDNLDDNSGAVDRAGAVITGLESYNVSVDVDDSGIILGGSPATRIQITVTHDGHASVNIPITAYRLN